GTNTPVVDHRQERQDKRIDQGASSGQLTDKEQKNLEKGQEHVENLEDKAKADGVVTRRERRRLHHAQNVQSRKIYNKKHNNRTE
ncbi:MAG: hypothetical protein JNK65_00910, partial [Deltaproteobacteria bacterium]|nr:hypothetical protein [Deltaproteobacteria bacterium]